MKRILLIGIVAFLAKNLNAQQTDTFTDTRDGKTYKTVKIGNQVWMAENLAYKPSSGNSWAYDNNSSNVANYGYMYDWKTASNVCPSGWHLPSDAEWTELIDFVGNNPGAKLKAKIGWNNNGNGSDDYGFSALPGGQRDDYESYYHIGDFGYWWSSTECDSYSWDRSMGYINSKVDRGNNDRVVGYSVRCVKDN